VLQEFLEYDYGDGAGESFADTVLRASEVVYDEWPKDPEKRGAQYGADGRAYHLNIEVSEQGTVLEWSVSAYGFSGAQVALVIPTVERPVFDVIRERYLLAGLEANTAGEALPPDQWETRQLQAHACYAGLKEQMWAQLRAQAELIAGIRQAWSERAW
jgi:hypothetical protein